MTRLVTVVLACALTARAGVVTAQPAPRPTPPPDAPARVLVMPFENVTRDSRIFWLSEASALLLADDLASLGVNAITRDERREAFERLQVPPATALTDATVIRIAQLVGAAQVVIGTLEFANETLTIRARSIALEAGRVQSPTVESGPLPQLFATFERVARKLAPPSSKTTEEVERQHPPVGAFEDYVKGLLAETPSTAINYLNAALKLDPPFDRARLALWDVYTEQGDPQAALAAVEQVGPVSPWLRRARFLAALSQLQLKKYDDAFGTFKALAEAEPIATVLNNLGIVQLRRPTTPQTGRATYYFNQAIERDPDDPDYYFNLGYAYWQDHDTQAAIYWLREAVRRNPTDGDAHFVLGSALAAAGNVAEAARERELARRLSSTYEQWEKRPASDPVPKGLERIKSAVELPHASRLETTVASSEQRDQQELVRFHVDRARRLFDQENDREALDELKHALYVSPYDADAHLLLGRVHLRNGRVREAIDELKMALWIRETVAAHVVLGDAYLQAKDFSAARGEADRALALDPQSADARALAARIPDR